MKSLLFALLLSSLAIIGCSGGEADIQCCVIDLEDAMCNNNEYIKLSKYASSIDYVPLETSDECALGSIFTMNIDEKCIYLFEFSKSRNLVTVFDISAGELVKVFNKRGRGPDEYVSAHWLGLKPEKDGSSKFIIPWFKGIYVYNIESEIAVSKFGWKQKTNRGIEYVAFNDKRNTIYVLMNRYQRDGVNAKNCYEYLTEYDLDGNVQSETFLGDLKNTNAVTSLFIEYGDKLRIMNETEDTIFNINKENNQLSAQYIVDYGKYEYIKHSDRKRPWFFKLTDGGVFETDRFVCINAYLPAEEFPEVFTKDLQSYFWKVYRSIILYDKEEDKTYSVKEDHRYDYIGFTNDIDGGAPFYPSFIKNDKMVQLISAGKFIELARQHDVPKMKEIAARLTAESNPVMVVATLK
jgi:hypothetical protein